MCRCSRVEQAFHHEGRLVGRLAPPVPGLVGREDRAEVQGVVHPVTEEQRQVVLGQPVLQSGRQQQQLIGCVRLESFPAGTLAHPDGGRGRDSAP